MKKIVLLILFTIILIPLTLLSQPQLTELQKIAIKESTIYPCLSNEQKIAIIKLENCNDYYQTYYDSIRPKINEENLELRNALNIGDSIKDISKDIALSNAALLKQESKDNKDLKEENAELKKDLEKANKKVDRKSGLIKFLVGTVAVETGLLLLIFL